MAETIALVGGETLLGREVREVLGETALGQHVRLVAGAEEETGTLTEIGGSPAFLAKLDPDAVEDAALLILAGSLESSKVALAANPQGLVIDLTYATEDDPEARPRPKVERGLDDAEIDGGVEIVHGRYSLSASSGRGPDVGQLNRFAIAKIVCINTPARSPRGVGHARSIRRQ